MSDMDDFREQWIAQYRKKNRMRSTGLILILGAVLGLILIGILGCASPQPQLRVSVCDRCKYPTPDDLSYCVRCKQNRCSNCVPCRTCRDEDVGR